LATDVDPHLLQRARRACYPFSNLKELPETWRTIAFAKTGFVYRLRAEFKVPILFVEHDIRAPFPASSQHLILCRNLIYTYFRQIEGRISHPI
jgi:chemotaxis protein methyltransferase CheR